ncbi:hypothetical protein STEG23_024438, partial [Scotinomys teguina]
MLLAEGEGQIKGVSSCLKTSGFKVCLSTPKIQISDYRQLPCEYWELNPDLLEEKPVFLTAEPSLQPRYDDGGPDDGGCDDADNDDGEDDDSHNGDDDDGDDDGAGGGHDDEGDDGDDDSHNGGGGDDDCDDDGAGGGRDDNDVCVVRGNALSFSPLVAVDCGLDANCLGYFEVCPLQLWDGSDWKFSLIRTYSPWEGAAATPTHPPVDTETSHRVMTCPRHQCHWSLDLGLTSLHIYEKQLNGI